MNQSHKKLLEKQQYRFVGEHSAIKICGWTKKTLKSEGVCYKAKFYGINTHRCIQMSPAVNFCDMDCIYCWRERNNSPFGKGDNPQEILEKSIAAQKKLLAGYKGNKKVDIKKWLEANKPMHIAISLNGEATYYPYLSELIKEIKKKTMSSFLVTNAQLPDVLKSIEPPTQLYISLDAPNPILQKKITRAMHKDSWTRLMKSLEILADLKGRTRTALRLTLVKGINDIEPENYANIIKKANPDFVEVKAYMFIGASRQRLEIKNMPRHEDVKEFAHKLEKYCEYKIVDEQKASRVLLMTKNDCANRFIDFKH